MVVNMDMGRIPRSLANSAMMVWWCPSAQPLAAALIAQSGGTGRGGRQAPAATIFPSCPEPAPHIVGDHFLSPAWIDSISSRAAALESFTWISTG